MSEHSERYDLVIIGLGAAGITAARLAASLELRIAIVERTPRRAGDVWTGTIPSRTLIESARVAHLIRHADDVGLRAHDLAVDTNAVWGRIATVSAEAAAHDGDPGGLATLGVDRFTGVATVTGPHEVTVDTSCDTSCDTSGDTASETPTVLTTRFVLLCTGSRPRWPDVAGLDAATALTTDTFWSLPHMPRSVVFIGGGSVSLELSQAMSRLGVGCTVLERERRVLLDQEPGLVDQLLGHLRSDGVEIFTGVNITRARRAGTLVEITGSIDGVPHRWGGETALVAAGRVPNVEALGLDELGVVTGPHGIVVDERGRSTIKSVYAAGDAAAPSDALASRHSQRSHLATHLAARAVRDMFFPGRAAAESFVSTVLFTDPELATTGLTVTKAEALHGDGVDVWRYDLGPALRNRVASGPGGDVVIVAARGRIVGAHVLCRGAGELISELALAIGHELKLSDLAHVVHPYPTAASAIGQVAGDSSFELAKKLNWLVRRAR